VTKNIRIQPNEEMEEEGGQPHSQDEADSMSDILEARRAIKREAREREEAARRRKKDKEKGEKPAS